MRELKRVLNIPDKRLTKGSYGVEIEVEGVNLPAGDARFAKRKLNEHWNVERDNSLKAAEAWEYVMPKPTDIKGVKAAIDSLFDLFQAHNSEVYESIKAGVHVHMNVQEWDTKRLFTFATVYFILEPLLVKWCGPNREGNLFCLRGTSDAEHILFQLQKAVEAKNLNILNDDQFRYCSLNFCSLFLYGSIEFRAMRSTPDLSLILQWVKILDELAESSKVFRNPIDVLMSMSGDGERAFIERMLPNYSHLFMFDGYERTVRDAARNVQTLAFTIDWDEIGKPSTNPFLLEQL